MPLQGGLTKNLPRQSITRPGGVTAVPDYTDPNALTLDYYTNPLEQEDWLKLFGGGADYLQTQTNDFNQWQVNTGANVSNIGGSPSTVEERDWVANFILTYGRLPTDIEVARGLPANQRQNYLPGSRMYELGFRNQQDYLNAQGMGMGTYGGYSGSLVPEYDWLVLTDEQGNPIGRAGYMGEGSEYQQSYIQKGQYITPPEGTYAPPTYTIQDYMKEQPGFDVGEDIGKYYRQYQPPSAVEQPKVPTYEEFEKLAMQSNPSGYYTQQLSDYLNWIAGQNVFQVEDLSTQLETLNEQIEQIQATEARNQGIQQEQNEATLKQLKESLKDESLTPEQIARIQYQIEHFYEAPQYEAPPSQPTLAMQRQELERYRDTLQAQLEMLMTSDLAEQISAAAQYYLSIGVPLEQVQKRIDEYLNYYGLSNANISQAPTGENLKQAYGEWETSERANAQNQLDYQQQLSSTQAQAQAEAQGVGGALYNQMGMITPDQTKVRITGTEKDDYLDFVNKLGVSLNSQAWLFDQFPTLVSLWQAKGRLGQTLMQFVQEYLANGGWGEYNAIPQNTQRFAPISRTYR